MDEQLQYLMKQVAGVSGDLTDGKLSPDLIKDLKGYCPSIDDMFPRIFILEVSSQLCVLQD